MKPLGLVKEYLRYKHKHLSRLPIIGQGAFSVVYADGPDRCIKVSICNAYREFYFSLPENDHPHLVIPTIYDYEHLTQINMRRVDKAADVDADVSLYRLERYKPFMFKDAPKESEKAIREFRRILDASYAYGHADVHLYGTKYMELVNEMYEKDSPTHLFYSHLHMISTNSGYTFDGFKRSNFGLNQSGQAVLLDPFFDCRMYRKFYM